MTTPFRLSHIAVFLSLSFLVSGCFAFRPSGDSDRTSSSAERRQSNSVTFDDVQHSPGVTIEDLLRRVPGVQVFAGPNGAMNVQVRGASSFLLNSEPLFVIDGIPLQNTSGRALFDINVQDIHSIEVLKDVSETSMYGVRGANGVIVIKRKR